MTQANTTLTSLGALPVADFLRSYWQRKPLLVRNAVDPEKLSVTGEELAGLALEDDVESRIIVEQDNNWQLHNGPFSERFFTELPNSHWTLLVQAVDHYLPEVHQLLDWFRFVPNWRLDDIMISYATAGGSVGPHFDQYDVFLLQGQGQRRWQLGQHCDHQTQRKANTPLCLIEDMQVEQDWLLNPGDLLYIPPGLAHFGVAVDNCTTYSVGFRSPSVGEAFGSLADAFSTSLRGEQRYRDSGQTASAGEISPAELANYAAWLQQQLADSDFLASWFGREMTRIKYYDYDHATELDEPVCEAGQQAAQVILDSTQPISKPLDSRWAFIKQGQCARLFVAGEELSMGVQLASLLCARQQWSGQELSNAAIHPGDHEALIQLLTMGLLFLADQSQSETP